LGAYWHESGFVVHNYLAGTKLVVDTRAVEMLNLFDQWRPARDVYPYFPLYSRRSLDLAVRQLTERQLLMAEGSHEASEEDAFLNGWAPWVPHAAWLHFATKDVCYAELGPATAEMIRGLLASAPQPRFFKQFLDVQERIKLKRLAAPQDPFFKLVIARRTHREFSSSVLSLDCLTRLLYYTWGVTGFKKSRLLGRLPLKTSPSGGARHPGEVYVMALRVESLTPGYYYYSPVDHALDLIKVGATKELAIQFCGNQRWVGDAAALFIMTAVFERTMWKYPHPRGYRVILAEAGHLCQTFCLAATALELAPFCTMALRDSLIESQLGLDGVRESVLYVAGVGMPAPARPRTL
jgi:SagB-type dehydrogenase family enzyme